MSVGEPQDAPPALLAEAVAAHAGEWNRYPPSLGTPEFRHAAIGYLGRRYPGTRGRIDPDDQISPVASTREGLYLGGVDRDEPVAHGAARGDAEPVLSDLPGRGDHGGCGAALPAPQRIPRVRGRPGASSTRARSSARRSSTSARRRTPTETWWRQRRCAGRSRQRAGTASSWSSTSATPSSTTTRRRAARSTSSRRSTRRSGGSTTSLVLHSLSKRSSAAGMRSGFAVGPNDVIARAQPGATERHRRARRCRCSRRRRRSGRRTRTSRRCASGSPGARTRRTGCSARIPATTGRPAASSCGSASATGSRWRSACGATSR